MGLIASLFRSHCALMRTCVAVALAAGLLVGCSKSKQGVYVGKEENTEIALELREDGSAALGVSLPALGAMIATGGTWKVEEYKEGRDEVVFYNDPSKYKVSAPEGPPVEISDDILTMSGVIQTMILSKELRWEVQDNGDLRASSTGSIGDGGGLQLQKDAPWKIHTFLLSEAETQLTPMAQSKQTARTDNAPSNVLNSPAAHADKSPPKPQPPLHDDQRQDETVNDSSAPTASGYEFLRSNPLHRYKTQVSDAIGLSWHHLVGPRMESFSYGTATVAFTVGHDGHAHGPRVISNTSNETFEIVTVESVLAADIPPMPPDVVSALAGSDLEMSYDFSVVSEGGGRGPNLSASASDSPKQNTR